MSTPTRVLGFAVGLAVVFAASWGLGALADPDTAPAADHTDAGHGGSSHTASRSGHEEPMASVHLALSRRSYEPGRNDVAFQVQRDDGSPVTSFDVAHEKELHLIVVDTRGLADFQHVHPTRAADGTWTAQLQLQPGTAYRMYADGSTTGAHFVATADLFTTGGHPRPGPLPEPATRATVTGLTVELTEAHGKAAFDVTRQGKAVVLEPYLGALGHLVVIRADDLSYLHVHPEEGPRPVFGVSGLAPGRYRYFLDFQVDGVVHTAAYTVDVGEGMPMGSEGHDHD